MVQPTRPLGVLLRPKGLAQEWAYAVPLPGTCPPGRTGLGGEHDDDVEEGQDKTTQRNPKKPEGKKFRLSFMNEGSVS